MAGEWSAKLAHYRTMFDNAYLGAWDIPEGRNVTVTIDRVVAGTLKSQRGTDKKPLVFFKGKKKAMVMNKTNCKTIAAMYGTDVGEWVGKQIAIYSTTTQAGGETVPCLRVKAGAPRGRAADELPPDPPEDEEAPEPGSDG